MSQAVTSDLCLKRSQSEHTRALTYLQRLALLLMIIMTYLKRLDMDLLKDYKPRGVQTDV